MTIPHERLLVILLRLGGVLTLLAAPMALLPESWMASNHRWLGLGDFPASPLVDYLTRSISCLYALHGGLLLLISTDPRRYAPIVRYVAWANVVLGPALLAIDLHAGMPRWWTLAEGPPLTATGLVLLWLSARVPAAPR